MGPFPFGKWSVRNYVMSDHTLVNSRTAYTQRNEMNRDTSELEESELYRNNDASEKRANKEQVSLLRLAGPVSYDRWPWNLNHQMHRI